MRGFYNGNREMDEYMLINAFALIVIAAIAFKYGSLTSAGFVIFYCVYITSDFMDMTFGFDGTLIYLLNATTSAMVMLYFLFCALYKPSMARLWFCMAMFIFICYVIPNASMSGLIDTKAHYWSTNAYIGLMDFNWAADIMLTFIGTYKERCRECDSELSL